MLLDEETVVYMLFFTNCLQYLELSTTHVVEDIVLFITEST